MSPSEPGLFRRNGIILAIYVDDTLIAGSCEKEVKATMDEILKAFSGKVIPADVEGEFEVRDILGVRLRYCRAKRTMTLDLEAATDKLASKFSIEAGRPISTPCIHSVLTEGKAIEFPIRSVVGGLQYIATMARPDIMFAVNRIARVQLNCTEAVKTAAIRVVRYLLHTKHQKLEYSPSKEAIFRKTYESVLRSTRGPQASLPDLVSFSDADFAGCSITLRSSTGSIIYLRGCPIAWSSRRQTLRANSTCESEYIALFDTLKLTQGQGYLDWLKENRAAPVLFTDNQSAIAVARATLPTKKTKHFLLRWHELRDHADLIAYCPTELNNADPLTKPMQKPMMVFHTPSHEPVSDTAQGLLALFPIDF
jgi:hypothetical protein